MVSTLPLRRAPAFPETRSARVRLAWPARWCAVAVGLTGFVGFAFAADAPVTERAVITETDVIWTMSSAERDQAHPLQFEARINFYDPAWHSLWFETPSGGHYLPVSNNPPALRAGQRVRITGSLVPSAGLSADRVTVTVLEENAPVVPLPTAGRLSEIRTFDRRVVVTEAYVDEQLPIDDEHLRLHLIVENRSVIGWVRPTDPAHLPDWAGKFVRLQSLYSARVDPTGTKSSIELWTPREADITVLGSIDNAPQFDRAVVPISRLSEQTPGATVKVRGRVQRRESGMSLVLRDSSGEVLVESLQRRRLPAGAEVEVVGRVALSGARWVIEQALFRAVPALASEVPIAGAPLRTVAQVRQLAPAEAERHLPVDLSGLAVWSLPEADFFFLQDLSGGVRVRLPAGRPAPVLQKALRVEGVTIVGSNGPAVELRSADDLGAMAHPPAPLISMAQALTGTEDGQWVGLRGFFQRTVTEGDWHWIHVTSPEGEFVGHLRSPVSFAATPGSLIRVNGVCESSTDIHGQAGVVRLRVPFLHDISIEEDAPKDPFDLPLRPVATLRQVRTLHEMIRVRVQGVVVYQESGTSVVIQDGETAVKLLARAPAAPEVGSTIEAVGILGGEGARTVLREAEFRPVSARPAVVPLELVNLTAITAADDERLVRVRGELIDVSVWPQRTRLTLRAGEVFFDASFGGRATAAGPKWTPGAQLELTGLCAVEFDDSLHPRGMAIDLRSPTDVVVVTPARFWTLARLWLLFGGLAGCTVLVVVWLALLRLRVRQQTAQIERQLAQQARLEAELERTQRMHSLGSLAGGIAHDFNNLLTGILGNVTFVRHDGDLASVHHEALREVEDATRRAKELTAQMITFAQGGHPERVSLDLRELVHGVIGLALSGASARAEFSPPHDLWPVFADHGQLARALQSLLAHARTSLPGGGVIPVQSANESFVGNGPGALAAGRYVRLAVEIPGVLVPPERLAGYFDPYVSSQFGDDRFALAIAYSIVKRHGGHLEMHSSPALGTVFRLWLPAADAAPVKAPTPVREPAPGGAETALAGIRVLVMDDEPIIRRLTERYLKVLRCEVTAVPDGAECVKSYAEAAQSGRSYQVVILDLTVPGGMGGREALEALRKLDPGVRAIVSSGYFNDPVMGNFRDYGFMAAVAKPYAAQVLAEAIHRVVRE